MPKHHSQHAAFKNKQTILFIYTYSQFEQWSPQTCTQKLAHSYQAGI